MYIRAAFYASSSSTQWTSIQMNCHWTTVLTYASAKDISKWTGKETVFVGSQKPNSRCLESSCKKSWLWSFHL